MRPLLRWGLRSIAATLLPLVLLAAVVAGLLGTQAGTRWTLDRIDAALAGELLLTDLRGTLWHGLEVSSLRYRAAGREIRATAVAVSIDWGGVLGAELALSELRAASLQITNPPDPEPGPKPLTLTLRPVAIDIVLARGEVAEFTLQGSGEPRHFNDIVLRGASLRGSAVRATEASGSGMGVHAILRKLRLTLAGDAPARADIDWSLPDRGWSGSGTLGGSLAQLEFVQSVAGPYPLQATGTVRLLQQTEPQYAAAIRWDDWPVAGYRLRDGEVRVAGVINDYHAEYQATAIMPDARELRIAGAGRGNLRQLDEFEATIDSDIGQAELAGTVLWSPAFVLAADVHLSGIDPHDFVAPLGGEITADAFVTLNDRGAVAIAGLSVSGTLNGAAIDAHGDIRMAPQQIQCVGCALAVGANRLRISGQTAAGEMALSVFIDAPALRQLWPAIAGSATGEGRLQGPVQRPQFTGVLAAQQLQFGDWAADRVAIDSLDSALDALDIRVAVDALRSGSTDFGSVTAHGTGLPEDLRLDIEWLLRGLRLEARGAVQATGPVVSGRIERALINEPRSGDWQLQDAFAFRYAEQAFSIDPQQWFGTHGKLQLSRFSARDGDVEIAASIDEFPLQAADAFLPKGFHLSGNAAASIELARRANTWSGTLAWRQQDTVLKVDAATTQNTAVRVPRAELQATIRDGGVAATAVIAIEPGVSGELELQSSTLDANAEIEAELRLRGDDWSWISAVLPDVDDFKGSISASIKASGSLAAPALSGDIAWQDGHVLLPALNAPLDNISVVISGTPQGTATIRGTAQAGSGTIAVDGDIERLLQATRTLTLNITGKAAELVDWPEYRIWGTPDLRLVGDAQGWRVGGTLTVPRAAIEVREIPVEATTLSTDVVVLGEEDVREAPTRIIGTTRLILGDRVRIKALGLDSGLAGDLLLHLRPDGELSAEGRITLVNGSFAAQGQKLTIQKGELTFTGPLDNPIVDVRAVRVIDTFDGTVTAGIHLHGRAQDLTSTVFSEPAMNDVDALSYLVIGRPLNQATEAEGGELSGAAVSLGLRQATRLTEQIGQTLGLDQLSLAGDGGDTTALIAGKKINARLYARYAYGVFSRLGTLLLRYKLSRHLTLEAGAGESQSIDILYSIETQ